MALTFMSGKAVRTSLAAKEYPAEMGDGRALQTRVSTSRKIVNASVDVLIQS
jgi:hypothetical protein